MHAGISRLSSERTRTRLTCEVANRDLILLDLIQKLLLEINFRIGYWFYSTEPAKTLEIIAKD